MDRVIAVCARTRAPRLYRALDRAAAARFLLNTGTYALDTNTGCAEPERASPQIDRRELLMSLKAEIGKIKRHSSGGWKVISNTLASF
jgi:hypothetical protein